MDEIEWIHRHPKAEDLRVGLISWAGTYLTFEACKNTVTATAKSLGRRQHRVVVSERGEVESTGWLCQKEEKWRAQVDHS
ncbi:FSCN3 isoform 4 [Pongo abelii]|uniref:FSCN3 isoform 4 n=1 Tax=Pongo abelii TaxID=9601 RepID=A0A2J8U4R7_PONAB|nr:FSCN3 isoform 4 [Pongo abelii]